MPTLKEKFCSHYGVGSDLYADAMFWRCLHRRALLLVPLIRLCARDYFSPDRELVRGVGRLTSAAGLGEELANFYSNPDNQGFVRRRLRLRVSVGRLSRIVYRLFAEESPPANDTNAPFAR